MSFPFKVMCGIIGIFLFPAGVCAGALDFMAKEYPDCQITLSKEAFQAQGGALKIEDVPRIPHKICLRDEVVGHKRETCEGATTKHLLVRTNGKVQVLGQDATGGAGLAAVLDVEMAKIRFSAPRINGAPVCVFVDAGWASVLPGKIVVDWP